jgi:hypothetical protein
VDAINCDTNLHRVNFDDVFLIFVPSGGAAPEN